MEAQYRQELEAMAMHALRRHAAERYSMRVSSHDTKETIISNIEAIVNSNAGEFAHAGTFDPKGPKPGWARIKLFPKQDDKRPKYKMINNYRCNIPRGVECDVPYKVYLSILDEVDPSYEEDLSEPADGPNRWKLVHSPRENVQLIAHTPGPDPRPMHETVKAKKNAPRLAFIQAFGYWPTDKELREAIARKDIDVKDPRFMATAPSTN
jgi:hypothetical protein